jgi:hypothetical protein
VLDAERKIVPNAFAIGLAAGFVPTGKLGGEPSFTGQANGLWLWQSDVGGMIVDAILDGSTVHEQSFPISAAPLESAAIAKELEI